MLLTALDRRDWSVALDQFSRRNAGRTVTLAVDGRESGAQQERVNLPRCKSARIVAVRPGDPIHRQVHELLRTPAPASWEHASPLRSAQPTHARMSIATSPGIARASPAFSNSGLVVRFCGQCERDDEDVED